LPFIISGASFISKKIKEQGFLRKSHQKTYPLDPGSKIRDPEKIHPGSGSRGVKKHQIPDPDPQHWSHEMKVSFDNFAIYRGSRGFLKFRLSALFSPYRYNAKYPKMHKLANHTLFAC
jgi:hypothetical protein